MVPLKLWLAPPCRTGPEPSSRLLCCHGSSFCVGVRSLLWRWKVTSVSPLKQQEVCVCVCVCVCVFNQRSLEQNPLNITVCIKLVNPVALSFCLFLTPSMPMNTWVKHVRLKIRWNTWCQLSNWHTFPHQRLQPDVSSVSERSFKPSTGKKPSS